MSRAESHEVGGDGREDGSAGGGEGDRASQENGDGGLLACFSFNAIVGGSRPMSRRHAAVTAIPPSPLKPRVFSSGLDAALDSGPAFYPRMKDIVSILTGLFQGDLPLSPRNSCS